MRKVSFNVAVEEKYRVSRTSEYIMGGYLAGPLARTADTAEGIQAILDTQEDSGGWKDPVSIMNPFSPFTQPRRDTEGYVTGGYVARMYRMINYLNRKEAKN